MDARVKRLAWLAVVSGPLLLAAQEPASKLANRYGYMVAPGLYPQGKPQEALQAVIKAIDNKKIDYLLAHLADPKFVDGRVAEYASFQKGSAEVRTNLGFERLARETGQHFQEDPQLVKELRQFLKDDNWEVQDDIATGTLKVGGPRRVYFRKVEDRWFLENKQQ